MSKIIQHQELQDFITSVYEKLGVPSNDAQLAAIIAVASDLRGVESHGVVMLPRKVDYMLQGLIEPKPKIIIERESPATALIDGGNGLGAVVASQAMKLCIQKAKEVGAGFVSVHDSNHYGIAGYYTMMALEHDMIGISMTNTTPIMAPTFSSRATIGTNPLSVAAPAGAERAFVLDMATSVVPSGKMTVYKIKGEDIPEGWAIDSEGKTMHNPADVHTMLYSRTGGGILPLGGLGELFGGHKGYGLSLMVDIFSGILSGSAFGPNVYPSKDGKKAPGNVGHFFGALSIEAFSPLDEFKSRMDEVIDNLKNAPKMPGQERIFIHGEKEFEIEEKRRKEGIPLHDQVITSLEELAARLEMALPF